MIETCQDRLWRMSEYALVEILNRVEGGDVTAEEALAILEECATEWKPEDGEEA